MNPSTYGWIIDVDHIKDADAKPGTNCNAVGLTGPHNIPPEIESKLMAGMGTTFRMKDDDGELYYEGRILRTDGSEPTFQPLDDFDTPNAGVTSIEYIENGAWQPC